MATLDQQIGALVAPLHAQIAQLYSIPGVDITAARDIIAEIGTDMSRCGDAARLASWAGVWPGNHESAGKRYRGKTCKGNRSLRRVLVPCAWGARQTPTFLGRTFRRLEVRLGKKKAALAIAHTILVIVSHLLTLGTSYEEARYDQYNPRQEARERQRALKALERLGYTVTLERAAYPLGGRRISASYIIGLPDVPKKRYSLSGSGASTPSQLFRRNPAECDLTPDKHPTPDKRADTSEDDAELVDAERCSRGCHALRVVQRSVLLKGSPRYLRSLTQRHVAQAIVDEGGDYVMTVKENQPQLRAN